MSTSYTLNVTQEVKSHFSALMGQYKFDDKQAVISNAEKALAESSDDLQSSYIMKRIDLLSSLLTMFRDQKWHLSSDYQHYVLSALQYFTEDNDVIPDHIPVIGLLDDCIVIDLVSEKLKEQLRDYSDFIRSMNAYGSDCHSYDIEEWNTIKKAEASSRNRHRRRRKSRSKSNRGTSFTFA